MPDDSQQQEKPRGERSDHPGSARPRFLTRQDLQLPPRHRWVHLILHTRNSWLHGDPRGFRDRRHRIHSSGDYKNPPPPGEHGGLNVWARGRAGDAVKLDAASCRAALGVAVRKMADAGCVPLVVLVGANHVHALHALPTGAAADQIIHALKRRMSLAIAKHIPRPVWAPGQSIRTIRDAGHQRNAFNYICRHGGEGAVLWTSRDPLPEPVVRKRADPGVRSAHPSASPEEQKSPDPDPARVADWEAQEKPRGERSDHPGPADPAPPDIT